VPESSQQKDTLRVAVGVLANARSEVLISQRLPGSQLAGAWEFPGGKLATGETPLKALQRELREELGIGVRYVRYLARLEHHYGDQRVCLYCWKVLAWRGLVTAAENQPLQWVVPGALMEHGLLAADQPLVERLLDDMAGVNVRGWQTTVAALGMTGDGQKLKTKN